MLTISTVHALKTKPTAAADAAAAASRCEVINDVDLFHHRS